MINSKRSLCSESSTSSDWALKGLLLIGLLHVTHFHCPPCPSDRREAVPRPSFIFHLIQCMLKSRSEQPNSITGLSESLELSLHALNNVSSHSDKLHIL